MKQPANIRYDMHTGERSPYLLRAREAASLTIPSVFPQEGTSGSSKLVDPYQGIGARALKSLSAKITLALLPANAPFFRLQLSESDIMDSSVETRGKIEEALASMERIILQEIEGMKLRPVLNATVTQLLLAGNVLLYLGVDGVKFYRLDKYVVKRDGFGVPVEIIIKETVSLFTLPKGVVSKLRASDADKDRKDVHLYTVVRRHKGHWERHQEVEGIILRDTKATYDLDRCPYLPLRLVIMDGEDYGRGYIEEHMGDLRGLETLQKAIQQAALAASKIVWMVSPNGTTKARTIQNAKNGDVVAGVAGEITALQMDKFADMSVARATAMEIERGLEQAFLMSSSAQRKGERVTATEIRAVTQELETILGGVYSLLSEELQLPMIHVMLGRLTDQKRLPKLPRDSLKPKVVTGVEGLGRGQDIQQLSGFVGMLAQIMGPEALPRELHMEELVSRIAAAFSLDTKGLVVTAAEREQQQQQDVNMQMMQSLGPQLLQGQNGQVN